MALRYRQGGGLVCAAISKEEAGDIYIDDTIHHILCNEKVIASECEPQHTENGGHWWWLGREPKGTRIDPWWKEPANA